MKTKTKTAAKSAGSRISTKWKVLLTLVFLLLVIASAVIIIILLKRTFWTNNPRFIAREIRVRSDSFWNKRSEQLCRRIQLTGRQNLFAMDLKDIRQRLERVPSIERAEVNRILPDVLELYLEERTPRAELGSPNSPYVVDSNGIVIPRQESAAVNMRLPVIMGVNRLRIIPGNTLTELQPALDVLLTALRGFPDIKIRAIRLVPQREQLEMIIKYRGSRDYQVIVPFRNNGTGFLLSALQSAIIELYRRGDDRFHIDLSFTGQVVIR